MRAIDRQKPDRLPVTIHQWQQWHLDEYMGGCDALEAFRRTGLDAAIQYFEAMGQFWIPNAERYALRTPQWQDEITVVDPNPDNKIVHHRIVTPEGELTYKTGADRKTTWITEYLIKRHDDVDLIDKYMPVAKLDKKAIAREYDRVGDAGILRGFVWGDQAGCWQHACCLMDVQELIVETFENPDWVHRLLRVLLDKKLRFIEESLAGAKFDLIETGGGAASDTVISPKLHREFCLPYDREMHRAVHAIGPQDDVPHLRRHDAHSGADRRERDRRLGNAHPARLRRQHHRAGSRPRGLRRPRGHDRRHGPVQRSHRRARPGKSGPRSGGCSRASAATAATSSRPRTISSTPRSKTSKRSPKRAKECGYY